MHNVRRRAVLDPCGRIDSMQAAPPEIPSWSETGKGWR